MIYVKNINEVIIDEVYDDVDGNKNYYLTILANNLKKEFFEKYPEADSMEICLEVPSDCCGPFDVGVGYSPTKIEDDVCTDYDWNDCLDISLEEIELLLNIVKGI